MEAGLKKIKRIKEKNKGIATSLSLALIPLSGFTTDIYIPSLPAMGASLQVSSIQVQLTVTIFLVSYGISQLFVGSIVDSFGRYRLALAGLLLFTLASLTIAVTHDVYVIYAMRIVHGITVALIIVAKRAYFVDVFAGDKLKYYLSIFTIIWSTGPIVAPFLGGYLQHAFGWQSNFYFLAAFAGIAALMEFIFGGETIPQTTAFNLSTIIGIYTDMIKTINFSLGIVMLGLAYSMVMVYNMTGPFIIEHKFALTPVVAGYCSLISGLAWMTGGFAGKATIRFPFFNKLLINLGLQVVLVVLMIFSLRFANTIYTMIAFVFMMHMTGGYTYNNYFTYSMSRFPKNAGIAGGLSGGIIYIIVSFLSYLVVYLVPAKDALNLSYSYVVFIVSSAIVMFAVFKVNRKTAAQNA